MDSDDGENSDDGDIVMMTISIHEDDVISEELATHSTQVAV